MAGSRFVLVARVSPSDRDAIRPVPAGAMPGRIITKGWFLLEGETEGDGAKEQNRPLLSSLRWAAKRTKLRAEGSSNDGTTQRFSDCVLKKTAVAGPAW